MTTHLIFPEASEIFSRVAAASILPVVTTFSCCVAHPWTLSKEVPILSMTNNLNQNNGPLYSLMCHLLVVFLVVLITWIYKRSIPLISYLGKTSFPSMSCSIVKSPTCTKWVTVSIHVSSHKSEKTCFTLWTTILCRIFSFWRLFTLRKTGLDCTSQ